MKRLFCGMLVFLVLSAADLSWADVFGNGANSFEIEFVTIGQPGNPPDANPSATGAVPYAYRIGKYEIAEDAIRKANSQSALDGAPLGLTLDTRGPDEPATSITWFEAAKFVDWLNTSTGSIPAYKFDDLGAFQLWQPTDAGYDAQNLFRNKLARYFLPSVDEWHKAAYYDPVAGHYWDYPTGSDVVPDGIDFVGDPNFEAVFNDGGFNPGPNDITNVGLLSPFDTAAQGGNITEWEETSFDRLNTSNSASRGVRGGAWGNISTHLLAGNRNGIGPAFEADFFGMRIASVIPEPTSTVLLGTGLFAALLLLSRYSFDRGRDHA